MLKSLQNNHFLTCKPQIPIPNTQLKMDNGWGKHSLHREDSYSHFPILHNIPPRNQINTYSKNNLWTINISLTNNVLCKWTECLWWGLEQYNQGGHRWTGTIPVMALAKTLIRAQVKSSRCISESSSSRSHRRQSQHFTRHLYFDMYHVLFLFFFHICAQLADVSGNVISHT